MKKFLISIFVLFAFFGMIGTAGARELSRTCRYTDSGEDSIVYLFVYSDGEAVAYVNKDRGTKKTGNNNRGNRESDVNNWDSSKYSNSCPEYLAYNGRLDFGYSVHVGDTEESLDYRPGPILSLSNFDGIDATCSYDVDTYDGNTQEITISVYQDGFITYDPLPYSDGGDSFGNLNGINYYMGDFYDQMYNDAGQLRQCPNLSLCEETDHYELGIGSSTCTNGQSGRVLSSDGVDNESGVDQEEDQTREVCTRYATDVISNYQYEIRFYYNQDGERAFDVTVNLDGVDQNAGGTALYNGIVSISNPVYNVSISVDPDYYDAYWSSESSCNDTPVFLNSPDGMYGVRLISGVRDENFSTAPDDSDGFETDNTASSGDQPFNPNELCQGNNCNISMREICTDSNVSNTLRSIGIIIVIIKVLVPAVIIIVGIKNLFMIITSGKEDDVKKYAKSIAIRVVVGVVIFLIPGIINFIYDAAQDVIGGGQSSGFDNCWNCLFDIDQCNTSGQSD